MRVTRVIQWGVTAARCVNAMEAVVGAEPGYRTVNDLPAFGARYGFRP